MNWLQKTCQSLPPTYMGVGHNYRWNADRGEYEEPWIASGDVIIWYHRDGGINERSGPHATTPPWEDISDAKGRIEKGNNIGSVVFNNDDRRVQRRILRDLVLKYPSIKFCIYGIPGGPVSLQDYWNSIS